MESSEFCEIPDVDSITALPVHTEDEIINPVINPPDWYFLDFQPVEPPSSNEKFGVGAADLPEWNFQELHPMDEFEVEETPALISVNVQLEAINVLLPICHPVAVCEELPNEGIRQAVEQQQEEPTRQERSQGKGPLMAEPQIDREDPQLLLARSRKAKLVESIRSHSNQLYPFVLPDSLRSGIVEHELPCMKPEPVVIAPVDNPPVQHFLPPSPAPKMEQCDAVIPLPAIADSFSFATTLPQPQPTLVPSLVGYMTYLAEAVTHTNVDMIEITQSEAQPVELTTPNSPSIHDLVDLTSPVMTAPEDLEVSVTPFTPQTLGFSSVADESGSECQLNGFDIWVTKTVSDWCKDYSNDAIDHTPAIPPADLELASSVIVTPVEIPEVMEPDNPGTKEPELVPNLFVRRKNRKWKKRPSSIEPLLPSLEATFEPVKPKRLRKRERRQQVAGKTSAGENENHDAPVVKHRIVWTDDLEERLEQAFALLGGLGSKESIPINVCYVMNCKSMTRLHVKSRLQDSLRCLWYPEDGNEESTQLATDGSPLPHIQGLQRRRRGLKASSSKLPDQQAAQQTLPVTIAMHQELQQQLKKQQKRSKELQAQTDEMVKQGKQLQQQMSQEMKAAGSADHFNIGRLMGEALSGMHEC